MKKLQTPLEAGKFYHIFNRGNNSEQIFFKPENYSFFLRRLDEYLSPFIEVYAYCLLPNYFHLLLQVRKDLHPEDAKLFAGPATSKAFHRLFTSYSKAINKQEGRHGSLFENPFKRKEVTDECYFTNLVFYIHANPQLHGVCSDFRQYPWSSYERILISRPTKLCKEAVIKWFRNREGYLQYHAAAPDLKLIRELIEE